MEDHPLLQAAAAAKAPAAPAPAPAPAAPASAPACDAGAPVTEEEKRERKKRRRGEGRRPMATDVSLGNHQRYYGYRPRVQGDEPRRADARLRFLEAAWWRAKKCKDVGCNDGTFSLELARRFAPRILIGVDADAKLVRAATALVARRARDLDVEPLLEASEKKCGVKGKGLLPFPHNCFFEHSNVASDGSEDHSFDVISAFSVTKWIHLNHGDEGLLKFFRAVYDQLKPGGRFILEPQQWKSYQNRRRASDAIKATFKSIKVKPVDFPTVLVEQIGFISCELLGTPDDAVLPEGFRRPIFCAVK